MTRIIDNNSFQGLVMGLTCADVDKAGFDDIFLGASGQLEDNADGMVTLVYGAPTMPDTISLGNNMFRIKRIFGDESADV